MTPPHFVVIGLGSIGRRHTSNLAALRPDATFTFVRHGGTDDETTRRYGGRVVTTVAAALDNPVDLAVLCTPSARHVDALPELIDRACPLLVEKPVVTDADHADRIEERLTRGTPAPRVAAFNLRFLPSLREAHHHVRSGRLGTVVRAAFTAGQWLPDWRPGVDYRTVYSADADLGGGVELDLAHEFDAARWLLGELDIAFARGANRSSLELRAHDTSVSVLTGSGGAGPIATVSLDYVSRRRVRSYELVGDEGRVQWDLDGRLELTTAEGTELLTDAPAFDVARTYVAMMEAMLEAGARGASTDAELEAVGLQPLRDGLASTRLAVAARDLGGTT